MATLVPQKVVTQRCNWVRNKMLLFFVIPMILLVYFILSLSKQFNTFKGRQYYVSDELRNEIRDLSRRVDDLQWKIDAKEKQIRFLLKELDEIKKKDSKDDDLVLNIQKENLKRVTERLEAQEQNLNEFIRQTTREQYVTSERFESYWMSLMNLQNQVDKRNEIQGSFEREKEEILTLFQTMEVNQNEMDKKVNRVQESLVDIKKNLEETKENQKKANSKSVNELMTKIGEVEKECKDKIEDIQHELTSLSETTDLKQERNLNKMLERFEDMNNRETYEQELEELKGKMESYVKIDSLKALESFYDEKIYSLAQESHDLNSALQKLQITEKEQDKAIQIVMNKLDTFKKFTLNALRDLDPRKNPYSQQEDEDNEYFTEPTNQQAGQTNNVKNLLNLFRNTYDKLREGHPHLNSLANIKNALKSLGDIFHRETSETSDDDDEL